MSPAPLVPGFPAAVIPMVDVVVGAMAFGAILASAVAIAERLAMRRRTLATPRCAGCSMLLASTDGHLPERCPECGADLTPIGSTHRAIRWVEPQRLPVVRLAVLVVGVFVAALGGLAAAYSADQWGHAQVVADEESTMRELVARCEAPGPDGARAVAALRRWLDTKRPTNAQAKVLDAWLKHCDPKQVAFGGSDRVAGESDWARAGDFVAITIGAVKREATATWVGRRLAAAVLPPSEVSLPKRVRPGSTYILATSATLGFAPVIVHVREHLRDGQRIGLPRPPTTESSMWIVLTAPTEPTTTSFTQRWEVDLMAATLATGGREEAATNGLPAQYERTLTTEVVDGPETIDVVTDPARDPMLLPGAVAQILLTRTEKDTCVVFAATLPLEPVMIGTWELEVPGADGAAPTWMPLAIEPPAYPLVRGKAFLSGHDLPTATSMRVRFHPEAAPVQPDPKEKPRELRYAREAFGLERTYELPFFEERQGERGTREREYRVARLKK